MRRLGALLLSRLGRIPATVEGDSYTDRVDPPARLIEEGRYVPGWYTRAPEILDLDRSTAPSIARQAWIYVHFDTERFFVVANIAHLGVAGNTAVLFVDKQTGAISEHSVTRVGPRNRIAVGRRAARLEDPQTGSFIAVDAQMGVTFSVHAGAHHFTGRARARFADPFVQSTRYHGGHGTLQWWGALTLEHGTYAGPSGVSSLPAGAAGVMDRTLGHRPSLQAWNWLAVAGVTEEGVPYSLQLARDRPMARPQVAHGKAIAWLGDRLFKIPGLRFVPGPSWTIEGEELSLRFRPRFDRDESTDKVVYRAAFRQFYGEVEGTLSGHRIAGDFAVVEDSLLQL